MNCSISKILVLQFLLLNQLLLVDAYKPKYILANDNINEPTSEYINQIPDNNFYILGPGDTLKLTISEKASALNRTFTINGEGIANLARLKRVYVSGLTIGELTRILNKEYSLYVKEPDVELLITNYRPIKIYIDGEVEQPGLHVLPGSSSPMASIENFDNRSSTDVRDSSKSTNRNSNKTDLANNVFFPSIIDAIRKAGGITPYADLTNIKVTRINSLSKGGGRMTANVDLIQTIDLKDSSQNMRLLDGDTVKISKNEKPVLSQISKAIKSNLNPKFINVYLGGRVEQPGSVTVSKNAVLAEAIEIGGGAKVLKGPVHFLRYNYDGSVDRRKFGLSQSAPRGSYKNPFLKNGDVIYIGKNLLNVTSEVLSEFTSPIQSVITSWSLFKILDD